VTSNVLSLGPAEAHVWLDDLNADAPWSAGGLLSDAEQARAESMRATDRRLAFVRGRSALRYLASQYLGLPPQSIGTTETATRKPVLDVPLHASIAHSGSVVAVAFTKAAEIGVDIEPWAERVDRAAIARRFFGPTEAEALAGRDVGAFFDAWVCKEAVLKATGVGLGGVRDVELSLEGGEPGLRRLGAELGAPEAWTLSMFDAGHGWSGAVAVRAPGVSVIVRRFAVAARQA
jgi:4'-phosphopantetheinyl transferase